MYFLFFSSYLPQFFFAMIAPVALFLICVWIDWRTALVLICCVPLIPVSIVAIFYIARNARTRIPYGDSEYRADQRINK